jgi:hypothetical protein
MRRALIIPAALSVVLSCACVCACNNAADDQEKAEKAQATAADKLTSATVEANQKIANAQAQADKKVAEATASFLQRKEDYRHSVTTELVTLDEEVAKQVAKANVASGQTKEDLLAKIDRIRTARDAFGTDYNSLQSATAETWDDATSRVNTELAALKKMVYGS